MLQVKDPQEVFDELIKSQYEAIAKEHGQELDPSFLNKPYSIFVLGEMYGTVSTCLAQNIPIPKELWDMPVVQSFVRGDVDDVVVVEPIDKAIASTTEDQWAKLAESAKQDIADTDEDSLIIISRG